jgi:hypothetical protein
MSPRQADGKASYQVALAILNKQGKKIEEDPAGWRARAQCPVHDGEQLDLTVFLSVNDYVEVICAQRCTTAQIRAALEEEESDQGEQGRIDARLLELENALLDSEGLANIPPPEPLIDGYLWRNSLAWIGGKPGHCKSFAAAEMACRIGTGTPWFGHATKQAQVLYLIAEGVPGFGQRIATWEQYHGMSLKGLVTFLPVPIQFLNDVDVVAFGRLLDKHRYDLVFYDTQARVTVGMKENDSTDMGIFVDKLGQLRRLYGATQVLVHHEPRNSEHLRGPIAMEGAADSIFRTFKEGMHHL